MKLRNLNKDYPNYQMEVLEIMYGKGSAIGKPDEKAYTSKQNDLLIENKAQGLISQRLKAVIDRAPQYVLPFAQTEIQNINALLGNTLDKAEGDIIRRSIGMPSNVNFKSKSWEEDAIRRYKQYLEAFVEDGCVLDEDQPGPEQAEMIFREVFKSLDNLSHNIVIEYRHYIRSNANDTWGNYEVISVAGCNSLKLFQKKIASCITDGITNLTKKLKKRGIDKKQFIEEIKQSTYKYKDLIADELFTVATFCGNLGWQIAFEKSRQDAIQNKIPDFIKAWDTGLSELAQRLIFTEFALNHNSTTPDKDDSTLSFEYISDSFEEEIDNMFNSLKVNKLIDVQTTKPKLRAVFNTKQITDKVIWKGGINSLRYFLKKLVEKGKIDIKADYWKIAQTCFTNNGVNFTTEQLKQAKIPGKKKVDIVDKLVSIL